ncbi:hypothetical protein [Moorena sp. SIO4G3]|uniref:hypothetical protein n=1 Tax=Moorena sp. SIO4G3 TaxID=2607821 RepID=UPI00142C543B|nr:hypothetical protein [Moorena sp. SIO4G3]NEO78137.1 hypothetical protein [Moorena sp. SIO4G3]
MGILVERASWWNGHLGGTGILVERASCPFQFPGGQYAPSCGGFPHERLHQDNAVSPREIRWIAEKLELMIVIFLASWK